MDSPHAPPCSLCTHSGGTVHASVVMQPLGLYLCVPNRLSLCVVVLAFSGAVPSLGWPLTCLEVMVSQLIPQPGPRSAHGHACDAIQVGVYRDLSLLVAVQISLQILQK